jgi:hypothetical protein
MMKIDFNKIFPPHLNPLPAGERRLKKVPSTLWGEVYPPLAAPKATRGEGEGLQSIFVLNK